MKIIGNIVCTIAILTQIILSSGLLSHAHDCQATQPITIPITGNNHHTHHDCGCSHYHHSENLTSTEPAPTPVPSHDCDCIPVKNHSYILSHKIIEQKPEVQFINKEPLPSSHVTLSEFSLLLFKSNQSSAPPPGLDYLPPSKNQLTSIHLGVFLI